MTVTSPESTPQPTAQLPVRRELADRVARLVTQEGSTPSILPGVSLFHARRRVPNSPVTYSPSIVIIVQGRKCGRVGDRHFVYDANNYLVLGVPLPFECETIASPSEPLYGIGISITPAVIAEMLLEMRNPPKRLTARPDAFRALPVDDALADATLRLIRALESQDDARILGPGLVREVIYRVLRGDEGGTLSGLAAHDTHFGQICRVLNRIHQDFAHPHDVESLASEAGMSVSTFHTHFKQITATSPLQYLKQLRLNKAHMLMVFDGATASEAARKVGYESVPQFNREFKRAFGGTPSAYAAEQREALLAANTDRPEAA